MSIEQKIFDLIESPLKSLNLELIRVKNVGNEVMQIMIDNEQGVGINECTKATKLIRNILHVAGLDGAFALEVSSPGLDRPLTKPEHFEKYKNSFVKLNTSMPVEGKKKFIGRLVDFDPETHQITLDCDNKIIVIDFNQVQATNLYYKQDLNL